MWNRREHAVALIIVASLAGCSPGGENGGGGESGDGGTDGASTDVPEVVAETEWGYERDAGSAAVEVHALRAHDELMELTLTITAEDPPDMRKETLTALFRSTSPYLVDTDNLNRHHVVEDTDGDEVRSDSQTDLPPGEPRKVSFMYAVPPEGVDTMDLYATNAPPVTDIPVLR